MASRRSCKTDTVMRSSMGRSSWRARFCNLALLNPFASIKGREPLRIFAKRDAVIRCQARRHTSMCEAKMLNGDRHAAGVGVGDLDMHIHDAAVARKAHGAKASRVAQLEQFVLKSGDLRVGVAVFDQA